MSLTTSTSPIAAASLDSWRTNAQFWDQGVGKDGNEYWRVLQEPTLARLFAAHVARPGCRALELATGNGLCARWLAAQGVRVLATDGAEDMLAVARGRLDEERARGAAGGWGEIEFAKVDVTERADFEELLGRVGEGVFDIVLCNMAIMDVATLEPMAEALPRLLKQDGVFVGTLLHPVFYTPRVTRTIEIHDDHPTEYREITRSMVLQRYMNVPPWKGYALVGQPAMQYYFHRPLHELLGTFFKTGLVLDALEEPAFGEEHRRERAESSLNYTQFPPIMAMRFRRGI